MRRWADGQGGSHPFWMMKSTRGKEAGLATLMAKCRASSPGAWVHVHTSEIPPVHLPPTQYHPFELLLPPDISRYKPARTLERRLRRGSLVFARGDPSSMLPSVALPPLAPS